MLPKSRLETVKLQLCADAGSAATMKPTPNTTAIAQRALIKVSQAGNRTDHDLMIRGGRIIERCVTFAFLQAHGNGIGALQVLDEGTSVVAHHEIGGPAVELSLGTDRKRLAV